jgi:hypothetical protein
MNLWLLLTFFACSVGEQTLTGQVVDVWGTPVDNATVIVVGQSERPFTDASGQFTVGREAGDWRIKVGKEGYIPSFSQLTISESTTDIPAVVLWPQPTSNGFYVLGEDRYLPLVAQPVTRKGNALKSHRGLTTLGERGLPGERLNVLFHTDLRPDQVHRLEPRLSSLHYLDETALPSALGAKVTVNLYVAEQEVSMSIETLPTRTDYLLTSDVLPTGAYAMSTQGMLTDMPAEAFVALPKELRVAWPFQR